MLSDAIQELMDRTGLDRAEARQIALQQEAQRAYQTVQSPPPQPISLTDWNPSAPPPSSSAPSGSPRSAPGRSPRSTTSNSGAAESACRCGGAGFYVADARYGMPQFGQLIVCACTLATRQAQGSATSAGILAKLHAELGKLQHCTFASFNLARPLPRQAVDVDGTLWAEAAQRESLLQALITAEDYAERPCGWLYIYGPVGAGKSHLAAAVANQLAAQGHTAAYATLSGLIRFLKAGFADNSADERLAALQLVDLLVIDEIGTQRDTRPGEWTFEQVYELLNARYLHERLTILTSNYPPSACLEMRLADRVAGMAAQVHLVAASYRQHANERRFR